MRVENNLPKHKHFQLFCLPQFGNEILHVCIFFIIHCQQFRAEMSLVLKSGDLGVISRLLICIRFGDEELFYKTKF